ncbi:MAG: hypothetical protein OXH84_00360 [Gammaproteobacteria bacterium]|nr:hypothetical protein [Gammaproteobacteria bacterium]
MKITDIEKWLEEDVSNLTDTQLEERREKLEQAMDKELNKALPNDDYLDLANAALLCVIEEIMRRF